MLERISSACDRLTQEVGRISALLVIALVGLVLYDALARYFFKMGSISLQELEWHLFAVMFLLGIPYALKHNKHVRLDLFYQHYSVRMRRILWIVANLLFILPLCAMILWYGYDFAHMSYVQQEVSDSGGLSHRYLIKSAPLLAFALLALQSLSEVIKSWLWLRKEARKDSPC